MGAVHNALTRGPLGGALTRALGDTRGSSGLERYGETLTPVMNLWDLPEWAYLRREYLCARLDQPAAVAGEYSGCAIVNPAGSNCLAVVEAVAVQYSALALFRLARATEDEVRATYLASVGRGYARDSRVYNPGIVPGVMELLDGSDAGTIGYYFAVQVNTAGLVVTFATGLPFILAPGQGLVCYTTTANISPLIQFMWRERGAFPGELE